MSDGKDCVMQVFLETERLLLRRFTEADVDSLFALDSDPDVMRFLNGGTPTPRAFIRDDFLPRLLGYYERLAGFGFWAAIEKSGGDFLGWFSFRPMEGSRPGDIELGYRLRKSAWGKGFATEGSRALIRKGFAERGVQRVFATTYEDNLASRRVMEKAGLTLARSYRLTPADLLAQDTYPVATYAPWDGDDVEYRLERTDWERLQAAQVPPGLSPQPGKRVDLGQ